MFQWTAHGHCGQPGVVAAALAEEVPPQESVRARPHWLEADLVKERVSTTRNVELGNAQVCALCQCYSITHLNFSGWLMVNMVSMEQLQQLLRSRTDNQSAFLFTSRGRGRTLLGKGHR